MLNLRDPKLFSLLCKILEDGLTKVKECVINSTYLQKQLNWPKISYTNENGMPTIRTSLLDSGPIDYDSFFQKYKNEPEIDFKSLNGYGEYQEYCITNKEIVNYFNGRDQPDYDFIKRMTEIKARDLLERYIHLYSIDELIIDDFKKIYIEYENSIYEKSLDINIYVPILFIKFDFDELEIADNTFIVKMDELFQLSRFDKTSYANLVSESVLQSATHALVLKGYVVENKNYFFHDLNNHKSYPLDKINMFFNALKIVNNVNSGYAQLIARPLNWANRYKANLIPLEGTTVRSYPRYFDNYFWLSKDLPILSEEDMKRTGNFFDKVSSSNVKKMELVNKRLHMSLLREDEEDSILDATIAMEALLSDGDKGELNHKLALRMAAIHKLSTKGIMDSYSVFKAVKFIYGYRSAVVHGSSKVSSKKEYQLPSGKKISTTELAEVLLGEVIQIMIDNPQYFNANKIDEELLLNSYDN